MSVFDVPTPGQRERDERVLADLLQRTLRAADNEAEENFEWSWEEQGPPRWLVEEVRVLLRLTHRDGRSYAWHVSIPERLLMLRGVPLFADEVLSAAAALVWRFYRPRLRISTRRRTWPRRR